MMPGAVDPAGKIGVLGALFDVGDIGEAHRAAILVGDDDALVGVGALDLVVGIERPGARRPVERALGRIDVGVGDGRAQIVDIETIGGEREHVGDHAHRGPLPAADADESHAFELRDLLRQARIGQILELRERQVFEVMPRVRIGASAGLTLA
jgi:hypothetical protein